MRLIGGGLRDYAESTANHARQTQQRTFSPQFCFRPNPALRTGLLDFGPLGQVRRAAQDVCFCHVFAGGFLLGCLLLGINRLNIYLLFQ